MRHVALTSLPFRRKRTQAQPQFPSKTVRRVVPHPAGTGIMRRFLAEHLARQP